MKIFVAPCLFAAMLPAAAATFTVTTVNDGGAGSLRQAILDANANPGLDTIAFAIPGPGPHTIFQASALPLITNLVVLDGYTQAGARTNTAAGGLNAVLQVELTTTNALLGLAGGLIITAGDSTVRGLVFNGFSRAISLTGKGGSMVVGNFFGVTPSGDQASPRSSGIGVEVTCSNGVNLIQGNLISGHANSGLVLTAGGPFGAQAVNLVKGNLIGTDRTGTQAVPNNIGITAASNGNEIGGGDRAARNVIAGHTNSNNEGLRITGSRNMVQGNIFGLDPSGARAIGNHVGISIAGAFNQIGGPTAVPGAPPGNVISASTLEGIAFGGGGSFSNLVQGNVIGLDLAGTVPLGNRMRGLRLDSPLNVIGGVGPGVGNLIGGNGGAGILITGSAGRSNVIAGNWIGTDPTGRLNLGNASHGLHISVGSGNLIGGQAGNLIAFNGGNGVALVSALATGNRISANSIYHNGLLGIDLSAGNTLNGVSPNDVCDADSSGANRQQNFPILTGSLSTSSNVTIQGSLSATADTVFRLEFFANERCDPSGHGEGQTYLGAGTVTNTPSCTNVFEVMLPVGWLGCLALTATATDPNGNTSEFSPCLLVGGQAAAPALNIVAPVAGQVTLSWTPGTPCFILQESLSLTPNGWTNSPTGATNPVVVPSTSPARFYRLSRP